jgi:ATP-dependent Clp protease adapter protein ClpS
MSERRDNTEHGHNYDLAVEEAKPRLKEPPLYRVVLINDD